ncbi:MAG: AAA family ATPase [Clostridiaceae bacterium]|nr:AAA family ATPase [Clostridiaceae bacterium]MBW4869868.1 AAA family ATPase [Clostridiaceae bacterium]
MIIKQLDLISFGKFEEKSLTLSDGMNIIYGNNEAGKTTIHRFIEGMFFGFFKPYSKRKIYSKEYERYFPWNSTEYRGVLKFIHKGEVYRIERNFIKGFDEVKIFDDKTGEDITHLFGYDPVLRLYSPSTALGFNSVVYNNTINIKQLGNKTDKILAKEIKDSLINIGGSLDEDISVKNAIEELNREINSIGTAGQRKTSPYGKTVDRLEKLYEERKIAFKYIEQIKGQEIQLNGLKNKVSILKQERESLVKKIDNIKRLEIMEKYEEAKKITREIDNLYEETERLKEYSSLNFDDYTYLISLKKEEDNLKNNIYEWNEELKNINNSLNELIEDLNSLKKYNIVNGEEFENIIEKYKEIYSKREKLEVVQNKINNVKIENKILDEENMRDLIEDVYKYEEIEEKKNAIFYKKEDTSVLFLKTRLEEKTKELKKKKLLSFASSLTILTFITLGFKNNLFFILILPTSLFLIYNLYSNKDAKDYIGNLNRQIQELGENEREKNTELEKLDYEMETILKKYNCSTKIELKRLLDENYEASLNIKNRDKAFKLLKEEEENLIRKIDEFEDELKDFNILLEVKEDFTIEDIKNIERKYFEFITKKDKEVELLKEQKELRDKINGCHVELGQISKDIEEIFSKNCSSSIEEFKEGLIKKEKYNSFIKDIDSKELLLNKILGNNNLEYLKKESMLINKDLEYDYKLLEKDSLLNSLKDVDNILSEKQKNMTRIEERINSLFKNFRPLVEIDEDILRKEKVKKEYEKRLKSLTLARDTIEKISKNIQRDFAPTLNKKVSDTISIVTEDKYKEVKINEKMDISVVEPESNALVDIGRLSGGTMDQIYFATRFGIVDILKEDKTPLILDDCFIQYDKNRLENILKFLTKESEKRQIILFTCHTREKDILDRNNSKFNYLNL